MPWIFLFIKIFHDVIVRMESRWVIRAKHALLLCQFLRFCAGKTALHRSARAIFPAQNQNSIPKFYAELLYSVIFYDVMYDFFLEIKPLTRNVLCSNPCRWYQSISQQETPVNIYGICKYQIWYTSLCFIIQKSRESCQLSQIITKFINMLIVSAISLAYRDSWKCLVYIV